MRVKVTRPLIRTQNKGQAKPRRLAGAALQAKVTAEARQMLAEEYGLPMAEYTAEAMEPYSLGTDMQPIMAVNFKRQGNGREVRVYNIFPTDNGELGQYQTELR